MEHCKKNMYLSEKNTGTVSALNEQKGKSLCPVLEVEMHKERSVVSESFFQYDFNMIHKDTVFTEECTKHFIFQYEVLQNLLVFTREEKSFTTYTLKKKYWFSHTKSKFSVVSFILILSGPRCL